MNKLRDSLLAKASAIALIVMGASIGEAALARGTYTVEIQRPDANGVLRTISVDKFPNTVVTVGKNLMLDSALAGSAYTVTGPFVGLISSTSFTAISAADTMTSHAGWLEAGGANAPTYSGSRPTASWSAASAGAKALASAAVFNITGTGTIKGAFMTYGSGAVATVGNTGGTLFSAGLFTGGDRAVISGDVVNVSYSVSL